MTRRRRFLAGGHAGLVGLAILLTMSPPGLSKGDENVRVERTFTSFSDFDDCFRDAAIDVRSAPGFVTLVNEDYVIDVRGNKAARHENTGNAKRMMFSKDLLGKRLFHLDTIEATAVELFFFGKMDKASVNGRPVRFGDFVHVGGWVRAAVGPADLRRGANEIVFHAGRTSFIDAGNLPAKNSFVSSDGGKTWQAAAGEFLVNVRLARCPARGVITSPVVDLANVRGRSIICPLIVVDRIEIESMTTLPRRTSIDIDARTGSTPWPDASWSRWQRARRIRPNRYVQWRATLRTRDRRAGPVLTRLTISADTTVLARPEDHALSVASFRNQQIIRSSFPYGFQRPSRKLKLLRERFKLDDVIADGKTDWDRLLLLRNWIRRQWPCNDAGSGKRTWNALEILGAPDGQHGMCVHFATAFTQCALALGYNARQVIIQNHFVADVWVDQYQSWVLMDVEAVYPPRRWEGYGTAHYVDTRRKRPLNCLQLHNAYHRALDENKVAIDDVIQVYSFDENGTNHVPHELVRRPDVLRVFTRFAYPRRNNYLDQLEPWEEYHGEDNYHSNDYLWWRSEYPRGAEPQYPFKTDRAGDLYWTINQAALDITVTEKPGVLTVTADTVTPNFDAFLYRVNSGKWQRLPVPGPDPDSRCGSFTWNVAEQRSTLRVKTVNLFGREGATTHVVVNRQYAGSPASEGRRAKF